MSSFHATMKSISIWLILLSVAVQTASATTTAHNKIIYLNKNAGQSIRLKSVLSIDLTNGSLATADTRENVKTRSSLSIKQIFWIFKRIYSIPTFSNQSFGQVSSSIETSQNEQMISLDLEVDSNLRTKYSLSGNVDPAEEAPLLYDLIIRNLSYADSGLYVCKQWNQKIIYYQLVVASKFFSSLNSLFFLNFFIYLYIYINY